MSTEHFHGLGVLLSEVGTRKPMLELDYCGCSREVRDNFNKYLVELFGYKYEVMRIDNSLIMHPDVYEKLKKEFK